MNKFFKDLLMHKGTSNYDMSKVICLMSFIVYFLLSFGIIFIGKPWSAMEYAGGISTIAVGFGLHFHFKNKNTQN